MHMRKNTFFLATILALITLVSSEKHTGDSTVYGTDTGAPACQGYEYNDGDLVAAIKNLAGHCGKSVRVTSAETGKSVTAKIVDQCGSCGTEDIDLSIDAGKAIGNNWDRVEVTWEILGDGDNDVDSGTSSEPPSSTGSDRNPRSTKKRPSTGSKRGQEDDVKNYEEEQEEGGGNKQEDNEKEGSGNQWYGGDDNAGDDGEWDDDEWNDEDDKKWKKDDEWDDEDDTKWKKGDDDEWDDEDDKKWKKDERDDEDDKKWNKWDDNEWGGEEWDDDDDDDKKWNKWDDGKGYDGEWGGEEWGGGDYDW